MWTTFDLQIAIKTNPPCRSCLALCMLSELGTWLCVPLVCKGEQKQSPHGALPLQGKECSSVGLAHTLSLLFSRAPGIASTCWGLQRRVQKTKEPVVETSGTCYGRNLESMRSMWQFSTRPAERFIKASTKNFIHPPVSKKNVPLCY